MRRVLLLVVLVVAAGSAAARAADYVNPVLDGDLPDPTVIRDADGFWAVTTSKDWLPAFPVLFSRDLVGWQRVGAVLPERPAWARGAFWAPELARWGGVVRVYFAAARVHGRPCIGVATARSPAGPWHERGVVHCPAQGAIDPYVVTDPGPPVRRWLVYKGFGVRRGIWLRRLTEDGLRAVGRATLLLAPQAPWEEATTEGPNLVRHDGVWTLIYSGGHCCSPPCTYAVGVAQAPAITGPYVRAAGPSLVSSPVLKCPGHGTLIDDAGGGLWYLHHGYVTADEGDVRRRVLLTPVAWGPDGWPVFGAGGTVPDVWAAPLGAVPAPRAPAGLHESFGGPRLGPSWEWPAGRRPDAVVAGGTLRLRAQGGSDRGRLVARQVPATDFTATARVRTAACSAGLAVVGFDDVPTGIELGPRGLRIWRGRGAGRTIARARARGPRAPGVPAGASLTVTVTAGRTVAFGADGVPVGPPVTTPPRGDVLRVALTCAGPAGAQARFADVRVVAGAG